MATRSNIETRKRANKSNRSAHRAPASRTSQVGKSTSKPSTAKPTRGSARPKARPSRKIAPDFKTPAPDANPAPPVLLAALRALATRWGGAPCAVHPGGLFVGATYAILGLLVTMLDGWKTPAGVRLRDRLLAIHEDEVQRTREATTPAKPSSTSSPAPRVPFGAPALDLAELPAELAAWLTTGRGDANDHQPRPLGILTREPRCEATFTRAARAACPGALCARCRNDIDGHDHAIDEPDEELAALDSAHAAAQDPHEPGGLAALAFAALSPLSDVVIEGSLDQGGREADAWAMATVHAEDALPSMALSPVFAGLAARFRFGAAAHARRAWSDATTIAALRGRLEHLDKPLVVAILRDGTIYGASAYAGAARSRFVAVKWGDDLDDLATRIARAVNDGDTFETLPIAARAAAMPVTRTS